MLNSGPSRYHLELADRKRVPDQQLTVCSACFATSKCNIVFTSVSQTFLSLLEAARCSLKAYFILVGVKYVPDDNYYS